VSVQRNLIEKEVYLDVSQIPVGSDGVSEYYWPIAMHETISMRDVFISEILSVIRSLEAKGSFDATILSILMLSLLKEAMELYRSTALVRRANDTSHILKYSSTGRLVEAIAARLTPSPSPLLHQLKIGPPSPSLWLSPARALKNHYLRDGINRRQKLGKNVTSEVVTNTVSQLLSQHANAIADDVNYYSPHHWFSHLKNTELSVGNDGHSCPHVKDILEVLAISFSAGGEQLPRYLSDSFKDYLLLSYAMVTAHLRPLLRKRLPIPNCYWRGTGTKIWYRMLSCVVREGGGTVVGHDHGIGSGFLPDVTDVLADLYFCDEFYTFSPLQAEGIRGALRPEYFPRNASPPSIKSIDSPSNIYTSMSSPIKTREIKTLMFVVSFYGGERVHGLPLIPDIPVVDWQGRLIAHLRDWGFKVILRPHPECRAKPPAAFLEMHNVELSQGSFEESLDEVDGVIFDSPFSTTFSTALSSKKPVILVDFEIAQVSATSAKIFSARCSCVRGWFDNENRPQVQWDVLRQGISDAPNLMDPRLANALWSSN
jgi:hypothetical protein